jgi:hypothetical protein
LGIADDEARGRTLRAIIMDKDEELHYYMNDFARQSPLINGGRQIGRPPPLIGGG